MQTYLIEKKRKAKRKCLFRVQNKTAHAQNCFSDPKSLLCVLTAQYSSERFLTVFELLLEQTYYQ